MYIYPKVEIDYSKCTVPFDCKKCLQVCPQAVFEVRAIKSERGKETDKKDPGAYRLKPFWRDKCTGCNECVEVCPVGALTIILPEEARR